MNNYWFKRYGKSGAYPVTWEGWAYFAFVVGLVTQTDSLLKSFTDSILLKALAAGVLAGVGFYCMRFKTNENEQFDKVKDRGRYKQLWGALIGMLLLVVVIFAVTGFAAR